MKRKEKELELKETALIEKELRNLRKEDEDYEKKRKRT